MRQNTKLPWWGWVAGLCLVPVGYVLSIFPMILIIRRFDLGYPNWLAAFYAPLSWAADEWKWFLQFLEWMADRMGLP